MNRFVDIISQALGRKSVNEYPVLARRTQTQNLDYTISMATSAVFYDVGMNNRDIDLRNI